MWPTSITVDGVELDFEDVLAELTIRHGRTGAYDSVNASTLQLELLDVTRAMTAGFHVGVPLVVLAGAPRFVGTVTDAALDDDRLTIIAAGPLSTLSRYTIGVDPWPEERWSDRVERAFAEAGVPELLVLQYDAGFDPLVVARGSLEEPPQPVDLLAYLGTLADDVAAAIVDTPDGHVLVQQLTYRTRIDVLTWATAPGSWIDAAAPIENDVANGDMSSGTEGWNAAPTWGYSTLAIVDGALEVTRGAETWEDGTYLDEWPNAGDRYLVRLRIVAPAGVWVYPQMGAYNAAGAQIFAPYWDVVGTGEWQELEAIVELPAGTVSLDFGVYFYPTAPVFDPPGAAGGPIGTAIAFDDVVVGAIAAGVSWEDANELGEGPLPTLVVDPSDVSYVPVWEQALALENETTIGYGDQEAVLVTEPASVTRFGNFPGGVQTQLATLDDATRRATERVRRLAFPRWGITQAALLRGVPLHVGQVVDLSGFPPASPHATWRPLLEGWTDTIRGADWNVELALSDSQLSGVALMWLELPIELAWLDVPPACAWKDAGTLDALVPVSREELVHA